MQIRDHDSHPEHPPTSAYARSGEPAARALAGLGYDGVQDAFGPWWSAEVGARAQETSPVDWFPRMAATPDEERALAARGFAEVAGLWVPSREIADSWARVVAQEPRLDLSSYVVESVRGPRPGGCDWKIFVEIYCDDYHVEPFHPGLASLADCDRLRWIWDEQAQAQVVGFSSSAGSGSPAYEKFVELSRAARSDRSVGAAWGLLYPSTMVEWLAGGVAVSTLEPTAPGACVNRVAFAYPRELLARCSEFPGAHQAAYWETAREDDDIARRIQAGRDALAAAGRDERGPAHPELEAGVVEFHRWMARAPWRAKPAAPPVEP